MLNTVGIFGAIIRAMVMISTNENGNMNINIPIRNKNELGTLASAV
ncbi:hypothetical protein [Clostridium tagluense]|nr:hypothetical protein [Clostridium tagluense]MBU3127626.1 hypothetical protein [Clostridium tagluense]